MLARVVDGVLVPLRAVLDQQLDQRDVVAVDRAPDRIEVPVARSVLLVRERVRVGAGLEQQARARADVGAASLRAAQEVEERDETVDGTLGAPGIGGERSGERSGSATARCRSIPPRASACTWRTRRGQLGKP